MANGTTTTLDLVLPQYLTTSVYNGISDIQAGIGLPSHLVCRRGVLVRVAVVLLRRSCVLLRLGVSPTIVIVRGFAVVMGYTFMMRSAS